MAIVIGPTPPGTGVIALAFTITSSEKRLAKFITLFRVVIYSINTTSIKIASFLSYPFLNS